MTILTSAGETHSVNWIDSPAQNPNALKLCMYDARRLSEIVAEFDGLSFIQRYDEQQGDKLFEGYSLLDEAKRLYDGSVLLTLVRE